MSHKLISWDVVVRRERYQERDGSLESRSGSGQCHGVAVLAFADQDRFAVFYATDELPQESVAEVGRSVVVGHGS